MQQPKEKGRIYELREIIAAPMLQGIPVNAEKHTEDDYIDFYYERNLPEMLSREGPKIAKGDVNGDGLEDFYMGGAKGQPRTIISTNRLRIYQKKNCLY